MQQKQTIDMEGGRQWVSSVVMNSLALVVRVVVLQGLCCQF